MIFSQIEGRFRATIPGCPDAAMRIPPAQPLSSSASKASISRAAQVNGIADHAHARNRIEQPS
jgi:hypothetical protein